MRTLPSIRQECFGQQPYLLVIYSEPPGHSAIDAGVLASASNDPHAGLHPILFTSYDYCIPKDVTVDELVRYLTKDTQGKAVGHHHRLAFTGKDEMLDIFSTLVSALHRHHRLERREPEDTLVFPMCHGELLKTASFGLRALPGTPQPH
jgi:hypothetical protein